MQTIYFNVLFIITTSRYHHSHFGCRKGLWQSKLEMSLYNITNSLQFFGELFINCVKILYTAPSATVITVKNLTQLHIAQGDQARMHNLSYSIHHFHWTLSCSHPPEHPHRRFSCGFQLLKHIIRSAFMQMICCYLYKIFTHH